MTGAREPDPAAPPVAVPPEPAHRRLRRAALPWLFLAPALVIFTYFKFVPMAQGMWMSLYEVRPYLGNRFVGGRNYVDVMTSEEFTAAIWHTVVLAAGQTFGAM